MHKMCKSDIGPSADTKHKLLNRETNVLDRGWRCRGEGGGVCLVRVKDAKQINKTLTLLITDLMNDITRVVFVKAVFHPP